MNNSLRVICQKERIFIVRTQQVALYAEVRVKWIFRGVMASDSETI